MKKFLSILLFTVMIISLVSLSMFSVSAEETLTDSQGVRYALNGDGTYYIVSGCDETVTEVVIPKEYNGLPVISIGERAFSGCSSLTSIEIPDSVTSIGDYAFYECTSLTSIEIPDSVTSIGEGAFIYCEGLTSVEIPDSVTSIGDDAFYWCDGLTSVVIPDSVTSMGDSAFSYCKSLTSIVIGDSVTSIGNWAFSYCSGLTSIVIPDSVTSIGDDAFYNCYRLTDIYCEAESQPDGWNKNWKDGCVATIHWGSEMTETSKPTLGNIDDDGDVDATDYIFVKRSVLNTYSLTEEQKKFADIDKDGDVDATDYVLVKRIVLGTYKVD